MALNIKDARTEELASEVARATGESKTRAVKVALEERKMRLAHRAIVRDRGAKLTRLLEDEIWPQVPPEALGAPLAREEREAILGYGPEGATARLADEALLCVGGDFARTDLALVNESEPPA